MCGWLFSLTVDEMSCRVHVLNSVPPVGGLPLCMGCKHHVEHMGPMPAAALQSSKWPLLTGKPHILTGQLFKHTWPGASRWFVEVCLCMALSFYKHCIVCQWGATSGDYGGGRGNVPHLLFLSVDTRSDWTSSSIQQRVLCFILTTV